MARQALLLLTGVLSLAVAAWLARRPSSMGRGILLGVFGGAIVALAGGFAVGFLDSVMPLAQLDFWNVRVMPWPFR